MGRTLAGLALLVTLVACGDADRGTSADVIDREDFIATYVELRVTALHTPDLGLTDQQRADILARHGVDEAGLLAFADVHGRDVAYMSEVWNDIDDRIQKQNGAPSDSEDTQGSH